MLPQTGGSARVLSKPMTGSEGNRNSSRVDDSVAAAAVKIGTLNKRPEARRPIQQAKGELEGGQQAKDDSGCDAKVGCNDAEHQLTVPNDATNRFENEVATEGGGPDDTPAETEQIAVDSENLGKAIDIEDEGKAVADHQVAAEDHLLAAAQVATVGTFEADWTPQMSQASSVPSRGEPGLRGGKQGDTTGPGLCPFGLRAKVEHNR